MQGGERERLESSEGTQRWVEASWRRYFGRSSGPVESSNVEEGRVEASLGSPIEAHGDNYNLPIPYQLVLVILSNCTLLLIGTSINSKV